MPDPMNLSEMIGPDRLAKGEWWNEAWTLTRGCTKCGPECLHCWAETMSHNRRTGPAAATYGMTDEHGHFTGHAEPLERHLEKPLRQRRPRVYSVWNDLFHEDIPDEFIDRAFTNMAVCEQHFFIVCTKRHERMLQYALHAAEKHAYWPLPNVLCMVTAGTQESAYLRIPALLQAPWAYRGVSCEPLLGKLGLIEHFCYRGHEHTAACRRLDWVVTGCESGPDRRHTKAAWLYYLIDQCQSAGVPLFIKQWVDGEGNQVEKAPFLRGRQWLEVPEVSA